MARMAANGTKLALIRQIDDAVNVVLAQETGRRPEPVLDRATVLQIGLQRQVQ